MDDKKAILVAGGVGGSDGSIGRCGGRKLGTGSQRRVTHGALGTCGVRFTVCGRARYAGEPDHVALRSLPLQSAC